jgi:hypothetical protein
VTPVVDGFVLRKGNNENALAINDIQNDPKSMHTGLVHSALPQLVHAHAKHTLITQSHSHPPIQLFSHQLIANKTVRNLLLLEFFLLTHTRCLVFSLTDNLTAQTKQAVESGPPRFTMREDRFSKTTPSLASYYENLEVEEWIQSVAGVLDQGWNDQYAFRSSLPSSKHAHYR